VGAAGESGWQVKHIAAKEARRSTPKEECAMLVLSRKVGEKLIIGDNITIVINRVAGNRVTIGIEAPDSVRVIRGELKPVVTHQVPVSRTAGPFELTEDAANASLPRLAK
jgi:carbon storage regulator